MNPYSFRINKYPFEYLDYDSAAKSDIKRLMQTGILIVDEYGVKECHNTIKELKRDLMASNTSKKDKKWVKFHVDDIKERYHTNEIEWINTFRFFMDGYSKISSNFYLIYKSMLGSIPADAPASYSHAIRIASTPIFYEEIDYTIEELMQGKNKKKYTKLLREFKMLPGLYDKLGFWPDPVIVYRRLKKYSLENNIFGKKLGNLIKDRS